MSRRSDAPVGGQGFQIETEVKKPGCYADFQQRFDL